MAVRKPGRTGPKADLGPALWRAGAWIASACLVAGAGLVAATGASGAAGAQTLDQALAMAYLNNPTLLAQRAQLRATDEQVPLALSGFRPTLTANGSAGKSRNSSESAFFGAKENRSPRSLSLSLRQPIFRGLRSFAETRQANNNVRAGRAQLAGVEQQVLLAAATSFMDVVRDQAVLELNIGNEQVLRRQLQAARDRFEVGEVTRTDVSQAEARVARAVADRVQAEGNLKISRSGYRNVVGSTPGKLAAPAGAVQVPATLEETIETAREGNPSVISAQYTEKASRDSIDLVTGELLPTITLNGDLSRNLSTSTRGSLASNASIIAQLSIPLYQAGSVTSRIRAAKQVAAQRRMQIAEARRAAVDSANSAWETLAAARARIRAFEAEVRANTIALDGVQQEAAAGLRTVLDVLDAEQELLDARVNLVRAQRDEVVGSLDLRASVGWLSAEKLDLQVERYDVEAHYNNVKNKLWGLGDPVEPAEK